MQKFILFIIEVITAHTALAQLAAVNADKLIVPVVNDQQLAIPFATVELLCNKDSALINAGITNK